jgi:tRNA U34 5-carboxymethylaminomethyl modifying GTPase MnmE/TrmE
MLSGRFAYLIRNVATYDFPPNDQQREVQAVLKDRMQGVLDELKSIVDSDVTSLNQTLASQGFPTVMIGTPEP